jgi:lipopolysaccharide transport system ATP-binding protein
MTTDIAVRAEGLSKLYRIGAVRQRHDTLRDYLADRARALWRRGWRQSRAAESFWALEDVSFELRAGQSVGVIGRNGAGKSTLLKILSRITEPTAGQAVIRGRVGSLLEVGTGFDRELSGRENIYLSGAILGMRKAEIDRKFDEIVAFAEVEKFLGTPIKHYSSGMYVRLAFAVAAHLEPEILLIDEVLAVGDAAFQRRCLGKMGEVARGGRTILFVSHNMAAVTRLCKQTLWISDGRVRALGDTDDVVAEYLAAGAADIGEIRFGEAQRESPGTDYIRLDAIRTTNGHGRPESALDARKPVTIEIEYRVLRRVSNLRVGFRLIAHDGTVVLSSTDADESEGLERLPSTYVSRCTIPGEFLNYGQYFVAVGSDSPMVQSHFFLDRALSFRVEETGGAGGHIPDRRPGLLRPRLPWKVERLR